MDKKTISGIASAFPTAMAAVLGLSCPALADSYAQFYNLSFPSGTTEVWISGTRPPAASNVTVNEFTLSGYGSTGGYLGQVGARELSAGSFRYFANLWVNISGSNYFLYYFLDTCTVASGSANTYYLRAYNFGGSYQIDATVLDTSASSPFNSGYQTMGTGRGNDFRKANITNYFTGCSKNSTYQGYNTAKYKNSTFSPWPTNLTYPNGTGDGSCPTNWATQGSLNNYGTGSLLVY